MKIIFEDEYLQVINKPTGIISTGISSLICHRLDRDTSGLLIIAKNEKVKQAIQAQFKARRVKKEYLALVSGIAPEKGRIEGYIVRHKKKGEKRRFIQALDFSVKEKHKRLAISEYQLIKKFKKELFKNPSQEDLNYFSLVKVRIFTGRTHQIRVQFASIHHPVIGDLLYGGKLMRKISNLLNIERQFLHAAKIEFIHPLNHKIIKLRSELPADLKEVLKKLN
ncbi:MAG: 23S rRNA pseudouridine synthase [Candidatus Berkelbacteria bacterium Licking1014_96]|uniref:23S rRNA pseudouridine synthase n=1 Tax=Candidatus Berkelbacteria bacterium Licking1014_96 TaxID=2017149 RepID=A0A554LGS1_9BACT|nr:MAG: 23S rRNA pseudouridine synthase [Candidatus Berkelbacteria bacterium Licking1014_96]